ncbi:MAG: TonB family protein, partial [Myxococcales bacterium]|nr:TonB family protein [Myxococcales bacterium]
MAKLGTVGDAEPGAHESAGADEAPGYGDNPRPDYPRLARRRGLEGTVLLWVEVKATGHAGAVEIRKSS